MVSSDLVDAITDAEVTALSVERTEGGSRYLSCVKTHLELAAFYARERQKEQARAHS